MAKEETWERNRRENCLPEERETGISLDGAEDAVTGRNPGEEEEEKFSFPAFCRESAGLLVSAYLFILFCIYPFFMKNGYEDIGDAKYEFYRYITLGGFAVILLLALGGLAGNGRWKLWSRWKERYSVTDGLVLLYGISAILSFVGSAYPKTALWGEDQWYMGLVSQLLFVLSYVLVSRLWEWEEKLVLVFLGASCAVFLLGILNRFSIYLLGIEGTDNGFLSTLGNINWYCGYWSVLFPLGVMMYWGMEELHLRWIGAGAVILGLGTGISQGGASAFLVMGALYLFVFCLSFRRNREMKRWLELVLLYGVCCQGLRLWRILVPTAFTYYEDSLSGWITSSGLTGWMTAGVGLVYLAFCLAEKQKGFEIRSLRILRQILLLVTVIGVGVYVFLMTLNTGTEGGFYVLKEIPLLTFSRQWGNARGATWRAGVEIFGSLPFLKQLTGVGPDCFALQLYELPKLAEEIRDQFHSARLTNAHNEWLTMLVNQGWLGLLSYAGIFVTAVFRWIRAGRPGQTGQEAEACGRKDSDNSQERCGSQERYGSQARYDSRERCDSQETFDRQKRWLLLFGMSAFAYAVHNMVSFQQILSTPFVFVILGMGECLSRETGSGQLSEE